MIAHLQKLNQELANALKQAEDLEAKIDLLRQFKIDKACQIEADLEKTEALPQVFEKLSLLAEVILNATLSIAQEELGRIYGYPTFHNNNGHLSSSEFVIVGMGKLGGQEMHSHSDLDLIFLYSRNGDTQGREKITNREYYAKLAQKIISYLEVYTRKGYAYKVDTRLRASGNQGVLVSSWDAYADYQRNVAEPWEKQALLKARAVAGNPEFRKIFDSSLKTLIFSGDLPQNLNERVHSMRQRMENELGSKNRSKYGAGGLVDIEFAIQYLQLKNGKVYESILIQNTLKALEEIQRIGLLKTGEFEILKEGYLFWRRIESGTYANAIEKRVGRESSLAKEGQIREDVRRVYLRILQLLP